MPTLLKSLTIAIIGGITFASAAMAETWNSDWGPVNVEADGDVFVGRYNAPVGGIVVMKHQGNGNYAGYWARSCTSNKRYQIPAPVYSSEGSCGEKRKTAKGSMTKCWGFISGNANPSNTRFQGTFSTCNNRRLGEWNGWQ
jgi:hypothetical protein